MSAWAMGPCRFSSNSGKSVTRPPPSCPTTGDLHPPTGGGGGVGHGGKRHNFNNVARVCVARYTGSLHPPQQCTTVFASDGGTAGRWLRTGSLAPGFQMGVPHFSLDPLQCLEAIGLGACSCAGGERNSVQAARLRKSHTGVPRPCLGHSGRYR